MAITLEELDGKYEVRSETSDGGPYRVNGDGITQIRKGGTYRKDKNGFIWESAFAIIGPDKLSMVSTLDPSQAADDVYIKDKKDNLTRDKTVYRGELIARQEAGRLVLSGEIRHGIVSTRIWLTRIYVTATRAFYAEMQPVSARDALTDLSLYKDVPDDWCIIVVNVTNPKKQGGTSPKNVTAAAGAAVMAVLNAANREEVAYVFNGDSATLLMSASILFDVAAALHGAREMAEKSFGLNMRVSLIWAEEISKRGALVRVAKTEIAPGIYQAALHGDGIRRAEQLSRDTSSGGEHDLENIFSPRALEAKHANFKGFECRWQPLQSRRGLYLTVFAAARQEKETARGAQMREILAEITQLCGKDEEWRPVAAEQLQLATGTDGLSGEAGVQAAGKGGFGHFLCLSRLKAQALLGNLCFQLGMKLGGFDGKTYKAAAARNTAFLTFDNAMHLVLDVTKEQKKALAACLEKLRAEGKIYYGLHEAPQAQLACFVFDYARQHHHFLFGADGGHGQALAKMERMRTEDVPVQKTATA